MMTKHFEDIMSKWQNMLSDTMELMEEGQQRFVNATKSYFDSMKYFSDIAGNKALSDVYESLSENIKEIKKDFEKK